MGDWALCPQATSANNIVAAGDGNSRSNRRNPSKADQAQT
jgi:hypothetical protein